MTSSGDGVDALAYREKRAEGDACPTHVGDPAFRARLYGTPGKKSREFSHERGDKSGK